MLLPNLDFGSGAALAGVHIGTHANHTSNIDLISGSNLVKYVTNRFGSPKGANMCYITWNTAYSCHWILITDPCVMPQATAQTPPIPIFDELRILHEWTTATAGKGRHCWCGGSLTTCVLVQVLPLTLPWRWQHWLQTMNRQRMRTNAATIYPLRRSQSANEDAGGVPGNALAQCKNDEYWWYEHW